MMNLTNLSITEFHILEVILVLGDILGGLVKNHINRLQILNYIARLKAEGMDEKTIASVAGVSIREL